jgi:hypothetical protein
MWLCSTCGETHHDTFEACWKCGGQRGDAAADAAATGDDRADIDALVEAFFSAFSNLDGDADVRVVYDLCIPQAVITKAAGDAPESYMLNEFIEPRVKWLNDGTLTEFSETETDHDTFVFGRIAQRRSDYTKSGVLNGEPFTTRGHKVFQFVKASAGWRISAVAWDDEVS